MVETKHHGLASFLDDLCHNAHWPAYALDDSIPLVPSHSFGWDGLV